MPKIILLVIAIPLSIGVLAGLFFRRSLLATAAAIFLITYSSAFWLLARTILLYQQGMAPTISRHNTAVLLASNPTYAKTSIVFHVVLGLFLLVAGTYFGLKRLREWRNVV